MGESLLNFGRVEPKPLAMILVGSIPLSTLQANVDYASIHCRTTYGVLGIKVWIYKGMFEDGVDEIESSAAGGRARARGRR